jgi:hypothetical protein
VHVAAILSAIQPPFVEILRLPCGAAVRPLRSPLGSSCTEAVCADHAGPGLGRACCPRRAPRHTSCASGASIPRRSGMRQPRQTRWMAPMGRFEEEGDSGDSPWDWFARHPERERLVRVYPRGFNPFLKLESKTTPLRSAFLVSPHRSHPFYFSTHLSLPHMRLKQNPHQNNHLDPHYSQV